MYKLNTWNDKETFSVSKVAQNVIATACGSDINTACGSDVTASACGSDINTAWEWVVCRGLWWRYQYCLW